MTAVWIVKRNKTRDCRKDSTF